MFFIVLSQYSRSGRTVGLFYYIVQILFIFSYCFHYIKYISIGSKYPLLKYTSYFALSLISIFILIKTPAVIFYLFRAPIFVIIFLPYLIHAFVFAYSVIKIKKSFWYIFLSILYVLSFVSVTAFITLIFNIASLPLYTVLFILHSSRTFNVFIESVLMVLLLHSEE